jgi:hypothetical protein
MIQFGFYLEGQEKERYQKACSEYYEVGGSVRFFDYCNGKEGQEKFIERVHAILAFTNQA